MTSPVRPSSDAGDLVKRLESLAPLLGQYANETQDGHYGVPMHGQTIIEAAQAVYEAAASIAALSEEKTSWESVSAHNAECANTWMARNNAALDRVAALQRENETLARKLRDTEDTLAVTETGMENLEAKWRAGFDEAVAANAALSEENVRLRNTPVDVILHCPVCLTRHVDEPQPEKNWTNPPHRTHECQQCGHLWRPYDVATNGVAMLPGQRDAWKSLSEENERLKNGQR